MPRLLIATTNHGKLAEIRGILTGLPIELASLADPRASWPEETGTRFAENAQRKALYYAEASGSVAVAEDSGLEIDALGGAPGVHSARFNGTAYEEKFVAIYARLKHSGAEGSTARFVCALALARARKILFEALGTVEGSIADAPRGAGGFGYDPIFYYPPYRRTLAEVSPREKAAVSHRGKAFRALRQFLEQQLSAEGGFL